MASLRPATAHASPDAGSRMSLTSYTGRTVLVVDDEPMVREVITAYLSRDGFSVTVAEDGDEALDKFLDGSPDLVVLDVMIPERDGLSVLRTIRGHSDTPVILLSARGEESDRVLGLELGADDYIVKPFSPRELATRARTVLKRTDHSTHLGSGRIAIEGLIIDASLREVWVDGTKAELTPKEFDLLYFLASSPRQVFSRAQLLYQVWDSDTEWQDPSTVTVHIRRLRKKIEEDPQSPDHLITVWGVGYRFES